MLTAIRHKYWQSSLILLDNCVCIKIFKYWFTQCMKGKQIADFYWRYGIMEILRNIQCWLRNSFDCRMQICAYSRIKINKVQNSDKNRCNTIFFVEVKMKTWYLTIFYLFQIFYHRNTGSLSKFTILIIKFYCYYLAILNHFMLWPVLKSAHFVPRAMFVLVYCKPIFSIISFIKVWPRARCRHDFEWGQIVITPPYTLPIYSCNPSIIAHSPI